MLALDFPDWNPHDAAAEIANQSATMSEFSFLSGRVLKKSLPVFRPPIGASTSPIKRLLLPQGELAQFYDSDEPVRYIAYIEFCAGGARGNHFHNIKEEWVYLIEGEIVLTVEDVESKARESFSMQAGDLVFVPKGVAHTFQTVKPGYAVEFSSARYNAEDTHRYPLI